MAAAKEKPAETKAEEARTEEVFPESPFNTLNKVNVNENVEKKNGLSYLSWAWAWAEVKKRFPDTVFKIYERDTDYGPVNYFTDGRTCWVKTGVIIGGLEHIEELPVMDFRNNSIPLDKVTSTDVNKAIQRSLTKAAARHGLGLYIYAGEDLPEEESQSRPAKAPESDLSAAIAAVRKTVKEILDEDVSKKPAVTAQIKAKIGQVDYTKCTDSAKLMELVSELKAA